MKLISFNRMYSNSQFIKSYIKFDLTLMQVSEPQIFLLPPELSRIAGATLVNTNYGQFLLAYDDNILYTYPIISKHSPVHLQKFSIPFIKELISLTKSYVLITTQYNYIGIFEINFLEVGGARIQFTVVKNWKLHKSFFIREVVENMIELHICEDEGVQIYQFTINGKMGYMSYSLVQQNKIKKSDRRQIYGSKSYFNSAKRSIFYLKNFSDKQFAVQKIGDIEKTFGGNGNYILAYVGICKTEEYMAMLSNFMVVNLMKHEQRHKIMSESSQMAKIQKSFTQLSIESKNHFEDLKYERDDFKVSQYLDLILIQDKENEVAYIYQIKIKGSLLIGVQHGKYDWFWAFGRRLIGISEDKTCFKYVDTIRISEKNEQLPINLRTSSRSLEHHSHSSINQFIEQENRKDFKSQQKHKDLSPTNKQLKEESESMHAEKSESKNKLDQIKVKQEEKEIIKTTEGNTSIKVEKEEKHQNQSKNIVETKKSQEIVDAKAVPYERFKPTKVIQRNKVTVSKTVHKSKQISPLHEQPIAATIEEKKIQQTITEDISHLLDQPKQEELTLIKEEKIVADPPKAEQLNAHKKEQTLISAADKFDFSKIGLTNNDRVANADSTLSIFNSKINRSHIFSSQNSKQDFHDAFANIFAPSKPNDHSFKQDKKKQSQSQVDSNLDSPNPFAKIFAPIDTPAPQNIFFFNPPESINKQSIFDEIFAKNVKKDKSIRIQPDQNIALKDQNQDQTKEFKALFQKMTGNIQKSIDQIPAKVKFDLNLPDKITKQIGQSSRKELKQFITREMTNRIETYFRQIAQDSDRVFMNTLEFYQGCSKTKLTNLQMQFDQQEKQVHEIHQISTMMKSSLQSILQESQESTIQNLTEWRSCSGNIQKNVHEMSEACNKYEDAQTERKARYQEIYQNLIDIKNMMREEANQKERKKLEREKRIAEKVLEKQMRQKKKVKVKQQSKSKHKTKKQDKVDMKKSKKAKTILEM